MDLVLSSIALVLLSPLMLLIAVAVKLESPGPVIYPSLRVGKKGRSFVCYKFRTMAAGAEKQKDRLRHLNERRGPFFKMADDPRVTRLGRFLRKYSLDELPQFWNVLKGEMSLVGPRPHPVEDCAGYSAEHRRRLDVKPGLTGLWQVTARANPSFETCMVLDLGYIRNWSFLLDCKILMRTIPAVLAGEGQ
jgi:lipopolysaccharide/colanic/teichoic acid biosynthesis glycosyltransferase